MDVQDEQDKGTKQIRPFGKQRPRIIYMDGQDKKDPYRSDHSENQCRIPGLFT